MDTEIRQVFLDLRHLGIDAIGDEEIVALFVIGQILIAEFRFDALGDMNDVFAMVVIIA
jgi:hypothetical protein